MAPCNGTQQHPPPPKLVVTLPPNGTKLKWHPAMAPRPLPQSWSSPPRTITQQWHHVNSPKVGRHPSHRPGTTSTPPKLALTLPCPHHSAPQWHPAMAPRPLPKFVDPPTTIAHYNGTQQWHHVHSPKVGRHPPPPNHTTLQCLRSVVIDGQRKSGER